MGRLDKVSATDMIGHFNLHCRSSSHEVIQCTIVIDIYRILEYRYKNTPMKFLGDSLYN
jgi:hypothetical protein